MVPVEKVEWLFLFDNKSNNSSKHKPRHAGFQLSRLLWRKQVRPVGQTGYPIPLVASLCVPLHEIMQSNDKYMDTQQLVKLHQCVICLLCSYTGWSIIISWTSVQRDVAGMWTRSAVRIWSLTPMLQPLQPPFIFLCFAEWHISFWVLRKLWLCVWTVLANFHYHVVGVPSNKRSQNLRKPSDFLLAR